MLREIFHSSRRLAARFWLKGLHPNILQIGITGSYGKTSTSSAIYAVLSRHAPTLMTDLNLDTIYNVPITALRVRPRHRYLVLELGIDSPGEMDFHLQIARPHISVVTGISPVHADKDHVGSLEAIIQQKGRIIEVLPDSGTAVLNHTNAHVREMASRTQAEVLFYGTDPACSYRVENLQVTLSGTRFRLQTPHGALEVDTPLLGSHSAVNLAGAAAVAQIAGVPDETIVAAFADLKPLEGRFSVEPGANGLIWINDSLRANPASTKAGLAYLSELSVPNRKIAVLGEMGELGDHEVAEHSAVGTAAAEAGLDALIAVGKLTEHTARAAVHHGMPTSRVHTARTVQEAAQQLQKFGRPGDLVYLKGSLMRHMERIRLILAGLTVGCEVISCPFYHQCTACDFLESGYNPSDKE